jgi:DNA-binding LacI/PurR family transcriptional regulator
MPRAASRRAVPRITSTAEFARYVGLARTTVSKVLNGHPGPKPKTVERVRRALEETGFTPNAFAKGLRGKRTATVGICMENLLTPPIVAKLAALQHQLRTRGFASLIEVLPAGESQRVLQHFDSMRVEGVVFIGHFLPNELADRLVELRRRQMPHVLLDQTEISPTNAVAFDRVAAMEEVTNHLLDLGHRHFGLLGISGTVQSIRERLQGIERALRARGLDPAAATRSLDYLVPRTIDFAFGHDLARQFAQIPGRPTAFLALNDEIAVGALLEFQKLGLRIPQDLSIVGFNNQDICQLTHPALASVDQQVDDTVRTAINLLLRQIEEPGYEDPVARIPPLFVPRDSAGPAPAA